MGETLKREFSIEPVDTGRVQGGGGGFPPGTMTPGAMTPPFLPGAIPGAGGGAASAGGTPPFVPGPGGMIPPGMGIPTPAAPAQAAPAPQPITRPSFLQAFLSNLGPALAGGTMSQPGMPFGTGLAGALQGIEEQKRHQQAVEQQQRQFAVTEEGLRIRAEREANLEQVRLQQEKNYQSLIATREHPPAKTELEQLSRDYTDAAARNDQSAAQEALDKIHKLSTSKSTATANPVNDALQAAAAAQQKGDQPEFQKQLQLAHTLAQAKQTSAPNEIELIQKSNAGDKDAKQALDVLQARRKEIAGTRGASQYSNFYDPDLQRNVRLSNTDAAAQSATGKQLIPTGPVPATQILQTQRAQNAIPAAIAEVRKHIAAWDNPTDRKIFAQAIKETPGAADHQTWFGNMLNQIALDKLSDDGKGAVLAMRRLNESLGSLRVVAALPSTVGSMAATMALAPGSQTPSAKFAGAQLDMIQQLVEQETGVPFLGMGKKTGKTGAAGKLPPITYTTKSGTTVTIPGTE